MPEDSARPIGRSTAADSGSAAGTTAHAARIYDHILGGKDHHPADQEAGDAMCRERPALPVHKRANRDWMNRSVRWPAVEAGMRQFLDIGTGIPTSPNIHEIARSAAPASRVVHGEPARDEDITMYGAVARKP